MTETNRLRGLLLVLGSFTIGLLSMITISSLPDSAINRNEKSRINFISVMPQGWAFFTRNAREEKYFIYRQQPDSTWQRVNIPGASLQYIFGLNRKGRAVTVELGTLLKQVDDSMWTQTNKKIEYIFKNGLDTVPSYKVKNICPDPLCTGNIIIQLKPPVPWAWADIEREIIMSSKFVKLYVESVPEQH